MKTPEIIPQPSEAPVIGEWLAMIATTAAATAAVLIGVFS